MTDAELLPQISRITYEAEGLRMHEKYQASVLRYADALTLLGENVKDSKYALMIYSGIGENYWLQQQHDQALYYYGLAVQSRNGLGFGPLHLRLGQLRYERGELEKAQDELMRAYMDAGYSLFEGEDPKYYQLIKNLAERT